MKQVKVMIIAFIAVILFSPAYTSAKATAPESRVIYIQNGGTITDPNWNSGITFSVFAYGDSLKLNQAVEITKTHFSMFDVLITTDETVFNSFDTLHRTKIIVGSTNVLGQDTGYSFNSSYMWGEDTPGFVLINNCNPDTIISDIGHLIAHESGHMFGLEHTLNPKSYYSVGYIMSNFTGKKYITWGSEDTEILTPILGLKEADSTDVLAYN